MNNNQNEKPVDPQAAAVAASIVKDLPDHSRGSKLTDFTKPNARYENGLSPAEEKLLHACVRGEDCVIGDGTRPNSRTDENEIRASFLRYLILGGCNAVHLHQRGVNLFGAYIDCPRGALDLETLEIGHELTLGECVIDGAISILDSKCKSVILNGSSVHELNADCSYIDGNLFLRDGFLAIGDIVLRGAHINGDFYAYNCEFRGSEKSIRGDGLSVNGNVYFADGFKATGEVSLIGAKINGNFECAAASFNCDSVSLSCDGIIVQKDIFLRDGFTALGIVRFLNAKVGGDFTCSGGRFEDPVYSLMCDGIEISGVLRLGSDFLALGDVRIQNSKIGIDIACRDGIFHKDIDASNAQIGGNVWLDKGFQLTGSLSLANATIGGNIQCAGATFHSKDSAIHANKAMIEGNVILGNCNAAGTFAFQAAKIGGDFSAQGATLSAKSCIQLRNAQIAGTFHWRNVKHAPGMLDLGGGSVKILNMDEASWQKPAAIKLNNFSYQGFEALEEGASTNYWIRFLEQQPEGDLTTRFRPKPFEQLASNLQAIGFEAEAKAIRVERQRRQTEFLANHDPDRFTKDGAGDKHTNWMHALNVFWRKYVSGFLVDYGYRPGKAAIYLVSLIFIGMVIYWHAAHKGIMTPAHPLIFKEATNGGFIPERCADNWVYFPKDIAEQCADAVPSEYSEFQSLIYAADVALPIVNFRMEADWAPRVVDIHGNRDWHGYLVRTFEWILIGAGWLLSLLFASAVGGIIRR